MNFGTIATVAGLVLGVLGVVPLLVAGAGSLLSLRRDSQILGFGRRTSLDVILTTAEFAQHPSGTSTSFRTNVGEVQGLGSVARALGRHYQGKPMRVQMSADIKNLLDGDVVVLGGPLLNDTAQDFIDAFNERYKTNILHNASGQQLTIGGYSCDGYSLKRKGGIPAQDLALVLLARNLFTEHPSRDVLCAGFTTYGTGAAAELFFNDLLSPKSHASAKPIRGADGAAIIAEIHMVNGQVTRWTVVHSEVFGSGRKQPRHLPFGLPRFLARPAPSYPAPPERGTTSPDS